ncbi:MAG: hypothetical protein L6408_07650 [Nanoarchaeota archaeon]|nr:hypothetical protein [Nanoarchaeota archaeon]
MAISEKFRGMSKVSKSCLAGAAFYTASLALPIYANQEVEKKIVEPITIHHLMTAEQTKNLYEEKFLEYSADKFLEKQEARNLHAITKKGDALEDIEKKEGENNHRDMKWVLDRKVSTLETDIKYFKNPTKDLDSHIVSIKENIEIIDKLAKEEYTNQKIFDTHKERITAIKSDLDNLIQIYYPGLIKGSESDYANLNFNADSYLVADLDDWIYGIIQEGSKIFEVVYDSKEVSQFYHQDLRIQDLISLRELLKVKRKSPSMYNIKTYSKKKAEAVDILANLKSKKAELDNQYQSDLSSMNVKLSKMKSDLLFYQSDFEYEEFFESSPVNGLEDYVEVLDAQDEYLEKYGNANKYWTNSMFLELVKFKETGLNKYSLDIDDAREELEEFFKKKGLELKVTDSLNPSSPKLPLPLAWLGGIIFVALRNFLISRFVTRREMDLGDGLEIALIPSILGPLLFFGLHELVYPAYMLGSPFLGEPIRKAFKLSEEL